MVGHTFAKANHPDLKDYDENKEQSTIIAKDATNQYGIWFFMLSLGQYKENDFSAQYL